MQRRSSASSATGSRSRRRRNITRAAERLHISQPALSARSSSSRRSWASRCWTAPTAVLRVTPAGELLPSEGRGLLAVGRRVFEAVRGAGRAPPSGGCGSG